MSTAAPSKHLATRQPMQPLQSTSSPLRAPSLLTTPSQPPASASQTTPAESRRPSVRAAWYWENRKAPNRWYWVAVSVLCSLASLGGYLQYRDYQDDLQARGISWDLLWPQSTLMLSLLFLPLALGAFEAQVAAGDVGEGEEVAFDAVGQANEVVGAFTQQSALLGELHVERSWWSPRPSPAWSRAST